MRHFYKTEQVWLNMPPFYFSPSPFQQQQKNDKLLFNLIIGNMVIINGDLRKCSTFSLNFEKKWWEKIKFSTWRGINGTDWRPDMVFKYKTSTFVSVETEFIVGFRDNSASLMKKAVL